MLVIRRGGIHYYLQQVNIQFAQSIRELLKRGPKDLHLKPLSNLDLICQKCYITGNNKIVRCALKFWDFRVFRLLHMWKFRQCLHTTMDRLYVSTQVVISYIHLLVTDPIEVHEYQFWPFSKLMGKGLSKNGMGRLQWGTCTM